jgi:hypothetical protein
LDKFDGFLSIIGTLNFLALTINAFFLKGIFKDIGTVKENLARIFERSDAKEKRLDKIEGDQKELFYRVGKLETQVSNVQLKVQKGD